ncbi:endothelial differentiation-related factor 1 [Gonapodya prolifera JEL478]|uniref:Endothelial differentiation-related factor 1 n=1 Tax=Gonapodya prolifera (strain JEL478) TaxID=1344416 RepID=A0A139B0K5_GONPJ|nr:endothelial differentiation-related factor 1 [Gonapodya prolifera JEL478]|eukprot:KXS22497.1 endothelial differentiation-related factor 1 [Gonapodya prolifera JEL478]
MSGWDDVTIIRKKTPTSSSNASATKKVSQANAAYDKDGQKLAKIDRETEDFHVEKVSMDVGKAIMKARQEKEFTQKDLATKINEKASVIQDYESGRAQPNQQVLGKLERALGVKLRGKDIGEPLPAPGSKK